MNRAIPLLLIILADILIVSAQTTCTNAGFESLAPGSYTSASSVTGWTLTNRASNGVCSTTATTWNNGSTSFSIQTTPLFNVPGLGVLPPSPLGGNKVAQLGDFVGDSKVTRLSQSFQVNSSNSLFKYALAMAFNWAGQPCCNYPGIVVALSDCNSQRTCHTATLRPEAQGGCGSMPVTYTYSSGHHWRNWHLGQIDLTPYIGSCVTIEFMASDCALGGHYSVLYLDTKCGSQYGLACGISSAGTPNPVSFCQGGPAVIQAPSGYDSYQWVSPYTGTLNAPSATMSAITITNPVSWSIYTVNLTTASGCQLTSTYTIALTQVSITSICSTGACSSGATGSATVLPTGSGSGYNYVWTNASNSVVSTASIAANLLQGDYTVVVTSAGGSLCGSATASVNVGFQPPVLQHHAKPFCNGVAILNTPPGNNHAWYAGSTLTSTNTVFTPLSPLAGQVYHVGFTTAQGCRDSIAYTLYPAAPGIIAVSYNPLICVNDTNGTAIFTFTPAGSQVPGTTGFSIQATGQTPSYSYAIQNSSINTFSVTGVSGGGTYSVQAFDGSCFATATFSANTYNTANYFNLTSVWSPTICNGSSVPITVALSGSMLPAQFTYSWSPPIALSSTSAPNVISTPSAPAGSATLISYSVTVTPTVINCPATKTIDVLVSNPITPTITSPGALCTNDNTIQLQGTPANGMYTSGTGSGLDSHGVLTPSLAGLGAHTFTYQQVLNSCSATAISSYTIAQAPVLTISGNTMFCSGNVGTLTASGAVTYSWQGAGSSSQLTISPATTTVYTVIGYGGNGCADMQSIHILVTPSPTLSVSGSVSLCVGGSSTLTASGAHLYVWNNSIPGPQLIVSPPNTTTYSVSGVNLPANCTDAQTLTITVYPLPTVNVGGSVGACAGELVTILATGAQNYLWNGIPGGALFNSILQSTTIFTVTGINEHGCPGTVQHMVAVDPCIGLPDYLERGRPRIYPNPVQDVLTVTLPDDYVIALYDALGKLVMKKTLPEGLQNIDMRSCNDGVYFLQLQNADAVSVHRIVKAQR